MARITLNNLAHSYVDSPTSEHDYAIKSLTHTLKQGGAYALLGPSGCGKSTLLNIISGLLTPSIGDIYFDDIRVNDLPTEKRNIAQVFQFPVVYDAMTVFQNLAFPLKNMGVERTRIDHKVNEIATLLELSDILHNKARNLSADQKQKVSMARGLVREDVSAILFDEPLTVIDPHLKWKLRRKLKQIHEQLNITMLYVTHDQLEAATFADEIALMYQGKIVQFGTPQDLFERPNHTFVGYFIGSPGMNFIPVDRSADGVTYQSYNFALSDEQQTALVNTDSNNIKLGIRPEFIEITDSEGEDTHAVSFESAEHLGNYQLLSFKMADLTLIARTNDFSVNTQSSPVLRFPAKWLKLYVDEYLAGEPAINVEGDND
jgi:glycerol transport system ATP-binding protein